MKMFYQTACGNYIVLNDHTLEHFMPHSEEKALLEEAISRVTLPNRFILEAEVVFDRVIGQSMCVAVDKTAPQMFAFRLGRDMPTRVAVGAEKIASSVFTVIANRNRNTRVWKLVTGFVGSRTPREPHDRIFAHRLNWSGFLESLTFWNSHALVWDKNLMGEPFESSWKDELIKMNHPCVQPIRGNS